jgi:hypothetical protein
MSEADKYEMRCFQDPEGKVPATKPGDPVALVVVYDQFKPAVQHDGSKAPTFDIRPYIYPPAEG